MSLADVLFAGALFAYLAGALCGIAAWRRPNAARHMAFGMASLGAVFQIAASADAIVRGNAVTWSLPFGVPLFPTTVRLDPLSAYFSLSLGLLALAVSVFSFGYLRSMEGRRNLGVFGFLYNLLLACLSLVFTAANAFLFLAAWELMAVIAFCLVVFEHENAAARRSGIVFLIMSHAGTGLLMISFLLLAAFGGSPDFANFRGVLAQMPAAGQGALFLMFFLGFGVKAGIVPLHIWLPDAHPVAPSNISALMSGIVIKTGIYGMARVFFDFYGDQPLWAGTTVLAIGVVTALVGVLYALMEHDLKRLLAYHSIENIGIIVMGFGAALLFRTFGHPNLAALALVAALYHTLNHAIFKGLLFLAAGCVVQATGTRNMEEMGGLVRRMPATSVFFLIGAVAISGLPPLNGFVSEWLTYQALLAGFGSTPSLTRVIFPVAGSMLALTAALAAACFVKAFGIPFLALPRSEASAKAEEASPSMRFGMGLLAASCFALGLGATWFLPVFDPITQQALGIQVSSALTTAHGFVLSAGTARGGTVAPAAIAVMLAVLAGGAAFLLRRTRSVRGPAWDCGLPGLTADNEFTATAFSKPLRMIFSAFYRPRREIQAEYEVSPYYPKAIRFESEIEPTFEKRIYGPLVDRIYVLARNVRGLQAGSIHAHLAYIFITLILLLLFGVRQ